MARNNNTINRPAAATQTIVDIKKLTVLRKDVCLRRDKDAPEHCFNILYKFDNVSQEQILEWASQSLNIRVQNNLRSMPEDFLSSLDGTQITVDASRPSEILESDEARKARERAELEKRVNDMEVDDIDAMMALLAERKAAREKQNNG